MVANSIVRSKVVEELRTATGLDVYEYNIPINQDTPQKWVVISAQSQQKTATSKRCYDWQCNLTIDVYSEQPKGFSSQIVADNTAEIVFNTMEVLQLDKNVGVIKNRNLGQITNSVLEVLDKTINRVTINYELWLSKVN